MIIETNYSIKPFKIRASACGRIMAGTVGLSEAQQKEYDTLIQRRDDPTAKPLTDNMKEKLKDLKHKKDNPELPAGAKSYCQEWLKEQLYQRRKMLSTKHMKKGHEVEDEALDFIAGHMGLGMLIKNEEFLFNDYMTGTPDAIPKPAVVDAKSNWDCFTFPLYSDDIDNSTYEWQGQVYMELTGKKKFILAYALMDTPIELIEKEARIFTWNTEGHGEPSEETMNYFKDYYTYGDLPDELRIKVFESFYSSQKTEWIIERVKLCRKYIDTLLFDLGMEPIHQDA